MSLAVNRVNNISFRANETQKSEQKSPETSQKSGLSDGEKIMAGLGAVAAITLGGILVKRRLDVKAAEKIAKKAQELLQKPKEFSYDNLRKLADEWYEAGKLQENDEVVLMGKSMLDELAESKLNQKKKWSKLFKAMKMSDNGFAVVLRRADKSIDMSTFKYFDPEKITEPEIVQSLKDNKIVVMPIKD